MRLVVREPISQNPYWMSFSELTSNRNCITEYSPRHDPQRALNFTLISATQYPTDKALNVNNLKPARCASGRGVAGVVISIIDTTQDFVNTMFVVGAWNPAPI